MLYLKDIRETFQDFPDNSSIAVMAFFYGCNRKCPGCQNPELQEYEESVKTDLLDVYSKIIESCKRSNTNKIVLSGGDPYCNTNPETLEDMLSLISTLESEGYEVCVYTGADISEVENIYDIYSENIKYESLAPLNSIIGWIKPTYLKCGAYIQNLSDSDTGKTDSKFTLATTNQRFYKKINDQFLPLSENNTIKFQD